MRSWLALLAFVVACDSGSESVGDENLRCLEGPAIARRAIAAYVRAAPACSRDDECVIMDTRVECEGIGLGNCGTVVHRAAVEAWDPDAVCDEIERLPAHPTLTCDTLPSCVRTRPVCDQGRCRGALPSPRTP